MKKMCASCCKTAQFKVTYTNSNNSQGPIPGYRCKEHMLKFVNQAFNGTMRPEIEIVKVESL